MEISGDGPGDDEGEDPGLAGVVQSQESVQKRHLIVYLKFEILDLFEEIMNFDCQFNLHSSSH